MNAVSFIKFDHTDVEMIGRAEGKSVVVTASDSAERGTDGELYGTHGIVSRGSKKTRGIRLRIGKLSIVIAAYTYGIEPPANEGAIKVYSTNATGTEQATHLLDSDKKHVLNGGSKLAARKTDTTKLTLSSADLLALATAMIGTNMFTPSGSIPVPVAPITFTDGEITSGTSEVLLP